MAKATGNTGTEKLALVAEKLMTTGKNGQRCWEMSSKAQKGTEDTTKALPELEEKYVQEKRDFPKSKKM
ncbi:hypothetical protein P7K49_038137 [Saguinus oedipus]|uniref:Uncharacterized protein n=1 Tax=Saguinus oedipus TaxID=9490 RepID=A0ABQ9TDU1_SAGOE|nr:hypothetical protein P7K49_038137 [Saguinus oedipus]